MIARIRGGWREGLMIANANLYFHWRQQCRKRDTLPTTGQRDKN